MIRHDLIADEMFLNDSFDDFGSCGFIPNAVGVDHHNWALVADAEAIGFGAKDAAGAIGRGLIESEVLEAFFQVIPGDETRGFVATKRFGLVGADENVAINAIESEFGDTGLEGISGWWHRVGWGG